MVDFCKSQIADLDIDEPFSRMIASSLAIVRTRLLVSVENYDMDIFHGS